MPQYAKVAGVSTAPTAGQARPMQRRQPRPVANDSARQPGGALELSDLVVFGVFAPGDPLQRPCAAARLAAPATAPST